MRQAAEAISPRCRWRRSTRASTACVRDGHFELMEVEVIEPYLFLPGAGEAPIARYVDAVTACVRERS